MQIDWLPGAVATFDMIRQEKFTAFDRAGKSLDSWSHGKKRHFEFYGCLTNRRKLFFRKFFRGTGQYYGIRLNL